MRATVRDELRRGQADGLGRTERKQLTDAITGVMLVAGDLRNSVRDAIRDELTWHRGMLPPQKPLPSDLDAEAQLVSRILNGCSVAKTHPLNGDDFYSPLHRVVFEAAWAIEEAGNQITTERVLVLMRLQEMPVTQEVCDDVNALLVNGSLTPLRELVERVLESARRRRMIGWLETMETELRLGHASVASTISRIEETLAKRSTHQTSSSPSVTRITRTG